MGKHSTTELTCHHILNIILKSKTELSSRLKSCLLLQKEAAKKPPQKRKATFYDIINMLRIKKLLNRKTTTTLTPGADVTNQMPTVAEVTEEPETSTATRKSKSAVQNLPNFANTAKKASIHKIDDTKPRRASRYLLVT